MFISYSRADFAFVQAFHRVLAESLVVRPWLDVVELRGGGDWRAQIAESIDESTFFVLVLSRQALRSRQVRWECDRARSNGVPIVLVRIDSVRPQPDHVGHPVYDLRRRFPERAELLKVDLEAGRVRGVAPGRAWLPPPAVVVVLAGHVAIIGLLLFQQIADLLKPVSATFSVRSRWIGEFAYQFTDVAAASLAMGSGVAVIFLIWSALSVVRRRVDPAGLICGLVCAALVVVVNDCFVSIIQTASAASTALPPPRPFWQHLLIQYAILAVAIVSSRTVWRHPDLQVRTALGRMRRLEVDDGEANDLSAAHEDREARWMSRVLPEWSPGGAACLAGTVSVRRSPGEDELAQSIEALCTWLGFTMTDTAPDHLVVLVGPRTDLDACTADALRSGARTVFVLVESLVVSADAEEIRRHQWVDLRRQEVDSYRDLTRSLHAGAVAADVASPPIDPSRFSAPLAVTWMTGFLIGQTILGLQLVIIRLAVPHSSASWGAVSLTVAAVYCAAGFAMASALVRHSWTPRMFRWCALLSFLSAVAVDVTLLHDSGSVIMIGFAIALVLLQLLSHLGCLVVSRSSWMARPAPGASLTSIVETFWPFVVVGTLLILLVSPVFSGMHPVTS